jgi:hypothetical protein
MNQVYILLKGGLGNQLFQFAFSKYLEKNGIVTSGYYENYNQDTFGRHLVLNNILLHPITCKNINNFNGQKITSESGPGILAFLNKEKVSTNHFLLEGYFQKFEYLNSNFIDDINFKYPVNEEILAIHLRRFDYAHHGILPISYYLNILKDLDYPKFIVYTDEVNFCNYVFSKIKNYCGVVNPNLDDPSDDFIKLVSYKNIVMSIVPFRTWRAFYHTVKITVEFFIRQTGHF